MHDMAESKDATGLPWLDQPVMLHSSRVDTCELTPEQCHYRSGFWRYWYEADHVYGLGTVYFMCAVIGVFTIAHILSVYGPSWVLSNKVGAKLRAGARYLSYSTAKPYRWGLRILPSSSFGVSLLILAGILFFAAMTLGPEPYYWPNTDTVNYGDSPPIATRSGWMALGLLPFVLALAAKANLVSALTGIPYEKLQIYHQWASYAMFVLALVHTFPFIVHHIKEGDMVMQWNSSVTYWTGVAALIPQAYLTFMSVPWLRNRYYEFFKSTHITMSILFIFFFFIHCSYTLTSWDYFIAAGSIYLFSVIYAWVKTYLFHGLHTAYVSLNLTDSGDEIIEITIPTPVSWEPGQHVFLRFLTLHPHSLTAHPFTISSVAHPSELCGHPSEMKFYVKPYRSANGGRSCSGSSRNSNFTARLANAVAGKPPVPMRVLLEGPYSGVNHAALLTRFQHIVYIAGGSGAGFSLGLIEDALRARCANDPVQQQQKTSTVQVVYATRSAAVAEWYQGKIKNVLAESTRRSRPCTLAASIHVTGNHSAKDKVLADENAETDTEKNLIGTDTAPAATTSKASSEDSATEISSSMPRIKHDGKRPDIRAIIESACADNSSGNTAVIVCGPASMIYDARQAVADEQARLLKGGALGEVYLHVEAFSW